MMREIFNFRDTVISKSKGWNDEIRDVLGCYVVSAVSSLVKLERESTLLF